MDDSGFVEMFDIGQHAVFAVVEGVIVGAGHQIDAEPFQFIEQLAGSVVMNVPWVIPGVPSSQVCTVPSRLAKRASAPRNISRSFEKTALL